MGSKWYGLDILIPTGKEGMFGRGRNITLQQVTYVCISQGYCKSHLYRLGHYPNNLNSLSNWKTHLFKDLHIIKWKWSKMEDTY